MRTVFRYRLTRYRGQILGWGIALALYALLMVQFYSTLLNQKEQFQTLIDSYPKEIAAFVGGMDDLFAPSGYLDTYIFSLMPLILGVFAVLMGSGLLASDEESGRLDLIMAHPISRNTLFWGRMAAFAVATVAILALVWFGLALPSRWTPLQTVDLLKMAQPCLSLLAALLLFGMLALLLSMLLPSRSTAAMTAGILLVGSFFLNGLAYLNPDIEPVAKLSPLYYYQGGKALDSFNGAWFSGLCAGALLFALLAWWRFQRRDIRVGGEGGWKRPTLAALSRLLSWRSALH
jgi:ABC-2 type transport system permease protein